MTSNDPFFLIRGISEHMLKQLEWMTLQPKVVAISDHFGKEALKLRYPQAEIIELEEGETVSLPDHSVDLFFANLLLPWCKNVKKTFSEWRRIVSPNGLLLFSSLGPDTLREIPKNILLLQLIDMHDLGDELIHAHWADPVLDMEYLTVTYRDLVKLLNELKLTKMVAPEVSSLLAGSEGDVFSLTYEIIYGHAWGGSLVSSADSDGVVKIPLSHLKRR
jgi:malonyl-CoA O-methyltransferase